MSELLDMATRLLGSGVLLGAAGYAALSLLRLDRAAALRDTVRTRLFGPDPLAERARATVARQRSRSGALVEGSGLWVSPPLHPPPDYAAQVAGSRILAVGNLKGGVGKTTLTGNLSAYLAEALPKPVLVVDLDFQGSLSSLAAPGISWLPEPGRDSLATALVSGDVGPAEIAAAPLQALGPGGAPTPQLRVVPAYYELAQAENRLTLEWLLSDREDPASDIRYRLARVLHAPEVRDRYSAILIDCPPRLTIGHIQALAAASHLIIPTIFDKMSAEAVVAYGLEVETFRRSLCPHLAFLGVAGSVWNGDRVQTERDMRDEIAQRLARPQIDGGLAGRVEIAPTETFLRDLVWFKSPNIAYATQPRSERDAKAWAPVEALGQMVIARMGLV